METSVIIVIIACVTAIVITLILCHYAVLDDEFETRYIEALRELKELEESKKTKQ